MSYQVSARKWRPQTFDEVVGQQHVARTLKNAIAHDRIAHAYLFSGMRGVGKTTMARILAKALNCPNLNKFEPCNVCEMCRETTNGASTDVIEIDGASNTSVDDVRELRESVRYAPAKGKYKVYIVDEVHMLSKSAFNAFLKTLEEPPPHTVFIFATTEPRKIPETIHSRCQCFDFKGIPVREIVTQLKKIAEKEGVEFEGSGIELIARMAEGGMRDALVSFDQAVSYAGKSVEEEQVREILGIAGYEQIHSLMNAILESDITGIVSGIAEMNNRGTDLKLFSRDFLEHLRNLTICKTVTHPEEFIGATGPETALIREQAGRVDLSAIQMMFQILLKTEIDMRLSPVPSLVLEMAFIRMTTVRSLVGIDDILARIDTVDAHQPTVSKGGSGTVTKISAGVSGHSSAPPLVKQGAPEPELRQDPPPSADLPSEPSVPFDNANKEELWKRIKDIVIKKKPGLGGILEHTILLGIGEEKIKLGFNAEGSPDYCREGIESNAGFLKEVIRGITGRDLGILFERKTDIIEEKKKGTHDHEMWKKKIVREVLDYFPGTVMAKS